MYKHHYKSSAIGLMGILSTFYAMGMEVKGNVNEDKKLTVTMYTFNQSNVPLYVDYSTYFDEKDANSFDHSLGRYRAFKKGDDEESYNYISVAGNHDENRLFSCVADEKEILVRFAWTARNEITRRLYSKMEKFDFSWEDISNADNGATGKWGSGRTLKGPFGENARLECSVAKNCKKSIPIPHVCIFMKFHMFSKPLE